MQVMSTAQSRRSLAMPTVLHFRFRPLQAITATQTRFIRENCHIKPFLNRKMSLQPTVTKAASSVIGESVAPRMSVEELKMILQDTLWGTNRGLSADSDTRAEISELISQLEAQNPTPNPNQALEKLTGTWKLAYTSNSELVALLALSKLPLITVGDILQVVDGAQMTVENRVQFTAPFSRTSVAATASFDIRSPKLLQVDFKEGQIATPELLSDFELPSQIDVLGQTVDLDPLKRLLMPLEGPARSAIATVGTTLSRAPDLKFPIQSPAPSSTWLLNTYLDDNLRVSRGDGGSIFVLIKEDPIALPAEIDWHREQEEDAVPPMSPTVVVPVGEVDLPEGDATTI